MKHMNDEAPVQAPTDIAGVGIHLSYMRRDIQKMNATLSNITSNYVPIGQFIELKAEVSVLQGEREKVAHWMDTWAGKVWGINFTIGAVITGAIFLLDRFIK